MSDYILREVGKALERPTRPGQLVAARIADPAVGLHVPHLADVEVAQALRRYARDGELEADAARAAQDDFRALDLPRHAQEPLLERVWALRHNLTVYDAVYAALAEGLDGTLVTCDRPLSRASGITCLVELIH